jgi:hypothetical protein
MIGQTFVARKAMIASTGEIGVCLGFFPGRVIEEYIDRRCVYT